MTDPLRVALVGGPMYDHLYDIFAPGEVEVVVHADHPTLNREVADLLAAGERIDLLATHSKYAPSQARWLRPLEVLLDTAALGELASRAVGLCRFDGVLLSVLRLIDVRILWVRSDRCSIVPDTWDQMVGSGLSFGFPGRESGLFGTFFEMVVGAGGALFGADGRPTIDTPEAAAAVERLCDLAASAPVGLPSWQYEEVDSALLDGRVDAAGAWPGAWQAIRSSPSADVLEPHLYPAGSHRRVSYAGCHSWGIPTTTGDLGRSVDLLHRLLGFDAQAMDASGGSICAHVAALASVAPDNDVDGRRLDITRRTIDEAMITYPPSADFPLVEEAGWLAINAALRGECSPTRAVRDIQAAADEALGFADRRRVP